MEGGKTEHIKSHQLDSIGQGLWAELHNCSWSDRISGSAAGWTLGLKIGWDRSLGFMIK